MTPGARIAAAIDILDRWLAGEPAERALTKWARSNRYAGSKDRAAVRDHVYDAIRQKRSLAAWGGSETGRGLMLGAVLQVGDPATVFTGQGYDPAALSPGEVDLQRHPKMSEAERFDWPDWLWGAINAALGADCAANLERMRLRAPVFLRANLLRATREEAMAALAEDDIESQTHALAATAILVTTNARRISASRAYRDGLVELQDAASQAVAEATGVRRGQSVLDFCAGGGGKSLALAALTGARVVAHDEEARRMRDLPKRAERAGADVLVEPHLDKLQRSFDLVICDAPCSGSGSWRRDPEGKWRLTAERLDALCKTQSEILDQASQFVRNGGMLAYATCSMLRQENDHVIEHFLTQHPEFHLDSTRQFTPLDGGDGFYVATLTSA